MVYRLLIVFIFGLFFTPSRAFACGGSPHTVVHSSVSASSCREDCCRDRSGCSEHHQDHKQCKGECGHDSCHCTPRHHSPAVLTVFHFTSGSTFPNFKKQIFSYSERIVQSACIALRLPPKIS